MKKCIASQQNILKYKKGFTLIESLVAIFILTISVTALLGVVSQSVFNSSYAKNKVVAVSLAQEGIELVRNIQDTKLLQATQGQYPDFETFIQMEFQPCSTTGGLCTIDPETLNISPCPSDGNNGPECSLLYLDNGYYNYDSTNGTPTVFRRSISITSTPFSILNQDENSGRVVVTVSWIQGSVPREVSYDMELFMWIQ